MRFTFRAAVLALFIVATVAVKLVAQASDQDPARLFASRSALLSQVHAAEQSAALSSTSSDLRAAKLAEAALIRQRLDAGDFPVGDRIVVVVAGESALSDTFTVRAEGTVQLGSLAPISLRGVLRGELAAHLTRELSQYIIAPRVTATPLLRAAVLGSVSRPGYLHVPADMLLSDLLMVAGGPSATADVSRAEIRRGPTLLHDSKDVQAALAAGLSLDGMSVRSGDELHVPQRRATNWTILAQSAAVVGGLAGLLVGLAR